MPCCWDAGNAKYSYTGSLLLQSSRLRPRREVSVHTLFAGFIVSNQGSTLGTGFVLFVTAWILGVQVCSDWSAFPMMLRHRYPLRLKLGARFRPLPTNPQATITAAEHPEYALDLPSKAQHGRGASFI